MTRSSSAIAATFGAVPKKRRDRGRRALVNVRRPHMERHGGDLERQPDQHEHDADDRGPARRLPASAARHAAREVHGAGEAVDQRDAVQQQARGQRAEHKILQPGFGRAQHCRGRTRPARRAPAIAVPARDRASSGSTPTTMTIMPTVANSTSTGNSNRAMPCARFQSSDRISASAAPSKIRPLLKVANASMTNWPLKPKPLGAGRDQHAGDQKRADGEHRRQRLCCPACATRRTSGSPCRRRPARAPARAKVQFISAPFPGANRTRGWRRAA